MKRGPKVLFLDIETAPLKVFSWGIWDQKIAPNQIDDDWFMLSWSAKWQGTKELIYKDLKGKRRSSLDRSLLKPLWRLIDQADVIVTQNGVRFDIPKIYARFIINGFKRPAPFDHIDTKKLAKKFGFSSHSLEYMAEVLNVPFKKQKSREFIGMDLWKQCLKGNPAAWRAMEKYNKQDVRALEGVYEKLSPWGIGVDFNRYHDGEHIVCHCGHPAMNRDGFHRTSAGKFQKYRCKQCGALHRGKQNLFTKEKRASLRPGV
jgi:hypothetical protein